MVVVVLLISGCATTDIMFWKSESKSAIQLNPEEDNVLTNAPNNSDILNKELKPVPMDEPLQIIAPDTSVSAEKKSPQARS